MAGTLNLALAQQFDIDGNPLAGALLYFFAVGTVATPQNSYQDFGLTILNSNPLEADQYGRIPMFYLADGQVHVRLTDANGVVIFDYPTMQVIGPSSGGGGGGSVDPTTIAATGDFKWRPTSEIITGWVKANVTNIGNATSGASQRANADTQALFVYLWTNFSNTICPVTPSGRGVSALADFNASKVIVLPDLRGRSPLGLDTMGASAAGRLVGGTFTSGNSTTPAATGGESAHTLTLAQAPNGQFTFNDNFHSHNYTYATYSDTTQFFLAQPGSTGIAFLTSIAASSPVAGTTSSLTGASISDHAGGQSHNNLHPFMLGTWYIKL